LDALGSFAKENGLLFIVDAISMFVTDRADMTNQNIDALIISSHKGLALPPGLSMVILSPKAILKINPKHQLYFDFNSYLENGKRGQTPYTPAVTIVMQLHQRLRSILKDGVEFHIDKAKNIAKYFRDEIKDLPLKPYNNFMPNAMTTLTPVEKNAFEIVEILDKRYDVVVAPNGGDLKNEIFRVSHMGDMSKEYVDVLIDALYDYYKIKRN
jgi:aspartate aminotransferase-like enzyme